MKRPNKKTVRVLCDLLEWAKGNRGTKEGNPYGITEVRAALEHLADLQGRNSYLTAITNESETH